MTMNDVCTKYIKGSTQPSSRVGATGPVCIYRRLPPWRLRAVPSSDRILHDGMRAKGGAVVRRVHRLVVAG